MENYIYNYFEGLGMNLGGHLQFPFKKRHLFRISSPNRTVFPILFFLDSRSW